MKTILSLLLLVFPFILPAQSMQDSISIHFLYGSAPAKGYKKVEKKHFGGIKGGHVNIEANGRVLDFLPGNCPILPENNKPTGGFRINQSLYWDTAGSKWITIRVPVTKEQLNELDVLFDRYSKTTPYDYAVFGMRCAAASYDVLSEIGLMKRISGKFNIVKNFYPKLLRKRMLKWADKNNYPVYYHEGKPTRKWEKDKGLI